MSCWYMSEIVLKLLPREDSHPLLFDAYSCALQSLALGEPQAITLRRFEWTLLREIGYGIDGQLPDFADPAQAETLRHLIRQRLEEYLPDTDLLSRKVMLSLRQN